MDDLHVKEKRGEGRFARTYPLQPSFQAIVDKRKPITKSLQTATALGVIFYHTATKNPQKARGAYIRVASNSVWFAYATKRFPILKNIAEEKFILGLSVIGMAVSSPQLYDALMMGNYISKAMSMAAIAAFNIRMVPPIEKFVRGHLKTSWKKSVSEKFESSEFGKTLYERLKKVDNGIEHFVYHNKLSGAFFKHSPSVIVGCTGLVQTVMALWQQNWPGFATGLASLFGTGMLIAGEMSMKEKQKAPEPSIFDPKEPLAEEGVNLELTMTEDSILLEEMWDDVEEEKKTVIHVEDDPNLKNTLVLTDPTMIDTAIFQSIPSMQ